MCVCGRNIHNSDENVNKNKGDQNILLHQFFNQIMIRHKFFEFLNIMEIKHKWNKNFNLLTFFLKILYTVLFKDLKNYWFQWDYSRQPCSLCSISEIESILSDSLGIYSTVLLCMTSQSSLMLMTTKNSSITITSNSVARYLSCHH